MKDLRISVRLSEVEHEKFKIICVRKKTTMQVMVKEFILREIKKNEENY